MKTIGMLFLGLLAGFCLVVLLPGTCTMRVSATDRAAGDNLAGAARKDDPTAEELAKSLAEEVRKRERLEESVSQLRKDHGRLQKVVDDLSTRVETNAKTFDLALKNMASYFSKNNTRISWRVVELQTPTAGVINVPFAGARNVPNNFIKGDRHKWGTFEVDFAPDQPLSGDVKDLCVVISGVTCTRDEHNVSDFLAETRNVRLVGTKVTGEYRFNLSDHDNNSSHAWTRLWLLVIAKIQPTK